jgi:hypothetical protein
VLAAIVASIVVLGSSNPSHPAANPSTSAASNPSTYAAEVNKLCALAAAQQHALPASVRTLKAEMATASTWQQRQQYVAQEVDSRITDVDNLLTEVDSLAPATKAVGSWQDSATNGLNGTLDALNAYQLQLQNVQSEDDLVRRVAEFDHNRAQFLVNAERTGVAIARIGGPRCLVPTPALEYVSIPPVPGTGSHGAGHSSHTDTNTTSTSSGVAGQNGPSTTPHLSEPSGSAAPTYGSPDVVVPAPSQGAAAGQSPGSGGAGQVGGGGGTATVQSGG